MTAASTDKLQKVGIGTATTLDAPGYTTGATSVTVVSTTNWPTTTGITFAIDEIDATGAQVANSYNEYVGVVASATSITSVSHATGIGTDRNYTAGTTTRVYMPVSAERENRIVDWGVVEHSQLGVHALTSSSTVTSSKFITALNDTNGNELFKVTPTASAVNEFTVANAATGAGPTLSATGGDTNIDLNLTPKATGTVKANGSPVVTYLGSTAQTANHLTGAVTTQVDITGFSLVFTVPGASARNVKLTCSVASVTNGSGTGTDTTLRLREGVTVLCDRSFSVPNGNRTPCPSLIYIGSFTAGSHTVQVSTQNTAAFDVRYDFSANNTGLLEAELLG